MTILFTLNLFNSFDGVWESLPIQVLNLNLKRRRVLEGELVGYSEGKGDVRRTIERLESEGRLPT